MKTTFNASNNKYNEMQCNVIKFNAMQWILMECNAMHITCHMLQVTHVTCHKISSYKQFYQIPRVSYIFGKLMQNIVQWSW